MHMQACITLLCVLLAAPAAGGTAHEDADTTAIQSSSITRQCSSPQLVARGCSACNPAADTCSKCRAGFVQRGTARCSTQICCNMKPVVTDVRVIRARLGESIAINLMRHVKDDQLNRVKVTVEGFEKAWGSGRFVAGADRSMRTYRFTPAGKLGVMILRYTARDPFKQATSGTVMISIHRNRAPIVKATGSKLPTITAGITAAYTTKELLQSMKSTDLDKDTLTILSLSLKGKAKGDAVQYHKPTKMWRYTCAAGKPCANGGNQLLLTVSDGLAAVSGKLQQPVKPRPAFKVLTPLVLKGSESDELVASLSEGQLTAAGVSSTYQVKVPQSEVMAQGELIDGNLLNAEDQAGVVRDGVEFVPDRDQFAVARAWRLPFTLGDTSRTQMLMAISSSKGTGSTATATDNPTPVSAGSNTALHNANAAAAPGQAADTGGGAKAAASGVVPANSCRACLVDNDGRCISNVNDPGSCPTRCVLDPYTMYCYMNNDPKDPCKTCTIDSEGSCIDSGDGRCVSCEVDMTGSRCVSTGAGGGDYVVEPTTPDSDVNYAWLVPVVRTTAVGMWLSLGCNTQGTITVEFNLADSEDFDGIDSDSVNGDVDLLDPRDTLNTITKPGGRKLLLAAGKYTAQQPSAAAAPSMMTTRRLQQVDSVTSGVVQNECYTGASYTPPKLAAAGDVLADVSEVEGKSSDEGEDYNEMFEGGEAVAYADDDGDTAHDDVKNGFVDPEDLLDQQDPTNDSSVSDGSPDAGGAAAGSGPPSPASPEHGESNPETDIGNRKRSLLMQQLNLSRYRCSSYKKIVNIRQEVPACDPLGTNSLRAGVWVGGYVSGSEGYIRQVRIQANVNTGGDATLYVGKTVIAQAPKP